MSTNPNPFTGPAQAWQPADNGFLVAAGDPVEFNATIATTAGTLYLTRLNIRSAITISTLWWICTAAGVGASSGSFGGLYSSAGTLLSGSADIGAALVAGGAIQVPLTTPQPVAAGAFVWAAFLENLATTQPTMQRIGASSVAGNVNLAAASFRFATNGTLLAALPASITPGSNAATVNGLWAGAS